MPYFMLTVCVAAQAITLWMTWRLWQVRDTPPQLPAWDLPQLPFGALMLATLVVVLIRPRVGCLLHVAVLLVSFVFDQYRTQPQFIAIALLMGGCCFAPGQVVSRWFLVSLWLWAGLHKFLSPEWHGPNAHAIAESLGAFAEANYLVLGFVIALSEAAQGVLAIWRPRWASVGCVLLHVGIVVILSPWFYNWNVSVFPWNLCTAVVGAWVLWNAPPGFPARPLPLAVAAALLIMPAGFYLGWVDHGIASVLYSGHLPHGVITRSDGVEKVGGIGELWIPFPNERRLLRIYFERSAGPGDKLHIRDPRRLLPDLYYLIDANGRAISISRERFLAAGVGEVAGLEYDDPVNLFKLLQAKTRLLRRQRGEMIYAVEIKPENYSPALLQLLQGLPNLEQLQLQGCPVEDADLEQLAGLHRLSGIGLNGTNVTAGALRPLAKLPALTYIECEGTAITDEDLARFLIDRLPAEAQLPGGEAAELAVP